MPQLSEVLKQATSIVAARGEGARVFDNGGRSYLDFTAGIAVTSTGHCHPRVVEAAQAQVASLIHGQYTTVLHPPLRELTRRLGQVLPAGLDSVFFANTGSEAVEAAVRLARQATGRPNIIAFSGGFHGRTVAAASLTSSGTRFRSGFSPLMAGVHHAPYPAREPYGWAEDECAGMALRGLDYLMRTLSPPDDTAAFIVEPVLGEGGVIPGKSEFFQGLRERADKHDILLIADEIQTGWGRTGMFWGGEHFDLSPDILVTAKGIASGFPLSAMAAPSALMRRAWPGSQGGTYGANAVACAAALATMDVIRDEQLVQNSAEMGEVLRERLWHESSAYPSMSIVRGLGLMIGAETVDEDGRPDGQLARALQQKAADLGLLLLTCGVWGEVVRFLPPLTVGEGDVDEAVGIWVKTLSSVLGS